MPVHRSSVARKGRRKPQRHEQPLHVHGMSNNGPNKSPDHSVDSLVSTLRQSIFGDCRTQKHHVITQGLSSVKVRSMWNGNHSKQCRDAQAWREACPTYGPAAINSTLSSEHSPTHPGSLGKERDQELECRAQGRFNFRPCRNAAQVV